MQAIVEVDGGAPLSDEILASPVPLVLRGLVADWPLVRAARGGAGQADAYLRRFYRDATVLASHSPPGTGGRIFYNDDLSGFNFMSQMVRFDQVLDALMAHLDAADPPTLYVGSTTVDTCLPGLRAENDVDLGGRDPLASIWIGNRTRIPAHYDVPDNLACVAAGRRRFTLFPPEQLKNLYVGPLDFTPAGQSVSLSTSRGRTSNASPCSPRRCGTRKLPSWNRGTRCSSPACGGTTSRGSSLLIS